MQITTGDRRIHAALARFDAMTYVQLGIAVSRSPGALRRRLPRLRTVGHADRIPARDGIRDVAVWTNTGSGALLSRTGLPARPPGEIDLAHTWVVTQVALDSIAMHHMVLTRAELHRNANREALRTGKPARPARTLPDLEIRTGDGPGSFVFIQLAPASIATWSERLTRHLELGHPRLFVLTPDSDVLPALQEADRQVGHGAYCVRRISASTWGAPPQRHSV